MQQNNIFCKERKVREMKKMTNNVIDTYNAVTGSIVAVLSYILGEHWILFVAFLALNICRLVNRVDESKYGRQRKFWSRLERCFKKNWAIGL